MENLPPGTGAIVEAAAEEVAQTLFSSADVPLARSDEMLAAIQGPTLKAVLAMRIEQILKHGHTAENDLMLPILWLPKQAKDQALAATEAIGVTGNGRDLALAKRRLARAAALCMAAIDRIDAAVERKEA
jgi:hypothetical protein